VPDNSLAGKISVVYFLLRTQVVPSTFRVTPIPSLLSLQIGQLAQDIMFPFSVLIDGIKVGFFFDGQISPPLNKSLEWGIVTVPLFYGGS